MLMVPEHKPQLAVRMMEVLEKQKNKTILNVYHNNSVFTLPVQRLTFLVIFLFRDLSDTVQEKIFPVSHSE